GRAEALVLRSAGREASETGRGGGQQEGVAAGEAGAFHAARIVRVPVRRGAAGSGCDRRDRLVIVPRSPEARRGTHSVAAAPAAQTSAAFFSLGSQVRMPPARQPRSRTASSASRFLAGVSRSR